MITKKSSTKFPKGASEASSSKKPRSRGLFNSFFCCLCRKESEPPPQKNNAPLLVEENGTLSKEHLFLAAK
ncbi:hypothetical protein JOQ06_030346 [Pogonophryne albipinna]|uniref:Uncharacterized protein n=1 Tax=Pogonophryne albipinna TaxID=1090488 RepID=A0AAD6B0M0_9TELE|nr:hypothetical protein JOQ06_030346 [Pogonophryne albipinna]